MAVTVGDCRRMIAACARNAVKLMIAYRLRFEQVNLKAISQVRAGRIGEPKFFNSCGTLYDIGVYCINAARYLFRAEPNEVVAMSVNSGAARVSEIDESTGALLRFDGERLAAFFLIAS